MTLAAISPRDNSAAIFNSDDGVLQVLSSEGRPRMTVSIEAYFARCPDTAVVYVPDAKSAIDVLTERATMSTSLDMTLMLFDDEISVGTRESVAGELESLLRDECNRTYVFNVLLSNPIPDSFDHRGALSTTQKTPLAKEVVESILNCQERVRLIMRSWAIVSQEQIVKDADPNRVFGLLSQHGVFRRVALEATDAALLDKIKASLVVDRCLQQQLDSGPRIVNLLLSEVAKALPRGVDKRVVRKTDKLTRALFGDKVANEHAQEHSLPDHKSDHSAYIAATSQVAKITELYGQKKDPQADSILKELIADQSRESSNHQHLVKSLCNIASGVAARGRADIGFICLMKALDFPAGIDAPLYIQVGDQLRYLSKFDEALSCYEHAGELDDGSFSDRIRHSTIRVTVASGKYDKALSEYLAIPHLRHKPAELSGLGTLYRKMGCLRESRTAYRDCLKVDEKRPAAFAGLAEICKQTGKPHQAVAEYNLLLRRFPDLDTSSRKVYQLARSHLFRLTQQYEKSESILNELSREFPADRQVSLHLAKLLALRGDKDRAREYFENANGPSLNDLADLAFIKATRFWELGDFQKQVADDERMLLPEDRGLSRCMKALDLIALDEFEQAQEVLVGAKFVDRWIGDFGHILRFHAVRRMNRHFDHKQDFWLSRIAKRSDRGLRQAISSISHGDFDEASSIELEFLLRIVA